MNEELLLSIQSIHEKIEEHEHTYQSALKSSDYNTLKEIRTQIRALKDELTSLEHSLFDRFRGQIQ
jgi:protein-arginine kinase activator protein McsA